MSDGFAEGVVAAQNGNGYGNGMWGMEWAWIIIIFALCGGWGGNWGGNNGGGQMMYDLGRVATTNDVASGFSTSAIMSNQGDLKLGQANLQHAIESCCCTTQRSIDQVRFDMAQGFCNVNQNMNAGFQRMLDYWCQRDMQALRDERDTYRNQLSQNAQTTTLLNAINRPASPAYIVPNPYTGNYGGNCCGNNSPCGC